MVTFMIGRSLFYPNLSSLMHELAASANEYRFPEIAVFAATND